MDTATDADEGTRPVLAGPHAARSGSPAGAASAEDRSPPDPPVGSAAAAEPPPLGELIARVARAIHFQSRQLLAPLGLTPAAARALRTLASADAAMRMGDLAERMHVVPRTVTTLVDTLEGAGLAARTADPADRRSTLVALTDAGHERLEAMAEARRTAAGELLSALDDDEQLQMRRLLAKLDLDGARPRCQQGAGPHRA